MIATPLRSVLGARLTSQAVEWLTLLSLVALLPWVGRRALPPRLFGDLGPDQVGHLVAVAVGSVLAGLQRDSCHREGLILAKRGACVGGVADVSLAGLAVLPVAAVALLGDGASGHFTQTCLFFGVTGAAMGLILPTSASVIPWVWIPLIVVASRVDQPSRVLTLPYENPPPIAALLLVWMAIAVMGTLLRRTVRRDRPRPGSTERTPRGDAGHR